MGDGAMSPEACSVCGWTGARPAREVNWNTLTAQWECGPCFFSLATAEAEVLAQEMAAGW